MIDQTAVELAPLVGTTSALQAVGQARATYFRHRRPSSRPSFLKERRSSPRELDEEERAAVRATRHSERFMDMAPAEVHATLLDEGSYLAWVPAM